VDLIFTSIHSSHFLSYLRSVLVRSRFLTLCGPSSYTDKKENNFFLTYKEIQSFAKSYVRKGMRQCANILPYMTRPLVIYDFVTAPL
jgi:hypothetical protein